MKKEIDDMKELELSDADSEKSLQEEYSYLKFDLAKPLEYQGQNITSMDLTKLAEATLNDLNGLYDTYAALGGPGMVMQEATLRFAQLAASYATGYPIEMIGRVSARDAIHIKNRVYRFFYH